MCATLWIGKSKNNLSSFELFSRKKIRKFVTNKSPLIEIARFFPENRTSENEKRIVLPFEQWKTLKPGWILISFSPGNKELADSNIFDKIISSFSSGSLFPRMSFTDGTWSFIAPWEWKNKPFCSKKNFERSDSALSERLSSYWNFYRKNDLHLRTINDVEIFKL